MFTNEQLWKCLNLYIEYRDCLLEDYTAKEIRDYMDYLCTEIMQNSFNA